MMRDDIEKTLKDFVNSPEAPAGLALSSEEIQVMLDRLHSYRERLRIRAHKHNERMAPLQRELADLKRSIRWARERLDAEGLGTYFSYMDQVETALLLDAIESKRGRIVAQRLLWGKAAEGAIAEETLGVLKAAVTDAKQERKKWFGYLDEQRKKAAWRMSSEWLDWDGAAYELGCMLGLFDRRKHTFQVETKHVFWTKHPVGNALHECLLQLVKAGIMERREEPDEQFRWNKEFRGSWEGK